MANKIKVNKKMIAIVIVIVVVLNIILIGISIMKNKAVDKPNMEYIPNVTSFYYYAGGDEYGRSETYNLNDFNVKHIVDNGTEGEKTEENYDFLIGGYNKLDEIIEEYKVKEWTNLEKNDIEILDGTTTSVKIEFRDGTIVELGDYYIMPENGWFAVKKIIEVIDAAKQGE